MDSNHFFLYKFVTHLREWLSTVLHTTYKRRINPDICFSNIVLSLKIQMIFIGNNARHIFDNFSLHYTKQFNIYQNSNKNILQVRSYCLKSLSLSVVSL